MRDKPTFGKQLNYTRSLDYQDGEEFLKYMYFLVFSTIGKMRVMRKKCFVQYEPKAQYVE